MKKCLLILCVCVAPCVFAQKSFFGVDAGVNVANQREHVESFLSSGPNASAATTVTNTLFFQNSIKPTFGVFYHIGLSEKIGLRPAATYMGLGYKFKNAPIDVVDINYLTFPLTVHYSIQKHFSFNAGPYLSFTLGGTKINNQPITSFYHKNDFGFSFGGEHDLYRNLSLGVNYFVGTKNIWLNDLNGTIKYTNRALQFTLIYKFKKTI